MGINGKRFMAINEPIALDLKTVSTLKEVLDVPGTALVPNNKP